MKALKTLVTTRVNRSLLGGLLFAVQDAYSCYTKYVSRVDQSSDDFRSYLECWLNEFIYEVIGAAYHNHGADIYIPPVEVTVKVEESNMFVHIDSYHIIHSQSIH